MPELNETDAKLLDALKESLESYKADEDRLSTELAAVKDRRKQAEKMVAAFTSDKPKRRRGRPRKTDTDAAAAAA
jgi:uncharacterized protein involved in exopolysaccharide biosynthesis